MFLEYLYVYLKLLFYRQKQNLQIYYVVSSQDNIRKLKFIFSKKAKKFDETSQSIWRYVVSVKLMVKISSNFVAFLENTNFMKQIFTQRLVM